MPSNKLFPILASGYVLRKLENPFVYNIHEDELYELDEEAFEFLKKCNGKNSCGKLLENSGKDGLDSLEYMLNEGIIRLQAAGKREIKSGSSPVPSLRYILLNITNKCNLACRHCYLGGSGNSHIESPVFEKAVLQFEEMGGLKLMISGGEPLLHPGFWELMDILPSYGLRVVLLSNGTLISERTAKKLSNFVHEVQISIDGINSHDILRGKGSFDKAMTGIKNLKNHDIPVSIATMVHRYNTGEFEEMQKLFSEIGTISWSVDVPCTTGSLLENMELTLDMKEAARFLEYGFGGGSHESTGNHTCGSHLCAVSPEGVVSKCGFFESETTGDVNDLRAAWAKLCEDFLWTLDKLECHDCRMINDCRGGCRFRAKQFKGILAPDPLLCYANGIMR